jgi:hypothetical protein
MGGRGEREELPDATSIIFSADGSVPHWLLFDEEICMEEILVESSLIYHSNQSRRSALM